VTELIRTDNGAVSVAVRALERIVVQAAERVEGVRVHRPRRSVRVEVEGGRARIGLELAVRRGTALPQTAEAVQVRVGEAIATMLELSTESVDVSVEEIA
jgi:uncharacterized alkaline shock family protein YloU